MMLDGKYPFVIFKELTANLEKISLTVKSGILQNLGLFHVEPII